jgi:hypothetical protein
MAKALTKIELLARIDAIELQFAAEICAHEATRVALAAAQDEINALHVQQRPSRTAVSAQAQSQQQQWPVVTLRGVPHAKVKAWEGGRLVTTYKPLS